MRLSPRAAFAIVALLSAVACASHQAMLPPWAGAPAIYASPPPHATIPLRVNSADKAGLNLVLNIAGGAAHPFLFDTGSAGLWAYFNAFGAKKTDSIGARSSTALATCRMPSIR